MRIAIVDDEKAMREQLEGYIARYAGEKHLVLDTLALPSGEALLAEGASAFDIILFDIDMPGLSGLDTARRVRETDENVVILFITNIAQYAINGYEVDAADYIIKPIGYYDFAMKFHKAVRRAERQRGSRMVVDTVGGPVCLQTDSILYVEVMAHYVIYHTLTETYRVRASMKQHEAVLRDYGFARCHKSFLINLRHLKHLSATEAVVGSFSVPVGRAYKDSILDAYLRYLHR